MFTKRILGITTALLGVFLILSSFYIKSRVREGRGQISEAQGQVRQGKQIFSLHPVSKEVGKSFTESAQNQIDEATEKANRYDALALWFQVGGSILIVIGAGIVFIGGKK